jgi:hypothetical protein
MKRLLVCLLLLVACGAPTAERPLLAQVAAPGYDPYLDALEDSDEQRQIDWERGYSTPAGSEGDTAMGVFVLVIVLVAILFGVRKHLIGDTQVTPAEGTARNTEHIQSLREVANDLSSLTDAEAERLSNSNESLHLNGLTSLSDAAAKSLSNSNGLLELNGLMSLSVAAAESLGSHKGGGLWLNGLTSLSDAAAEGLSKYEGIWLHLEGLTSLTDAAAESLSKHKGMGLYLHGLTSLSNAAAESLSKHKGKWLVLEGLTSLSRKAAKSLAKKPPYEVFINLDQLPDSAAKILRAAGHPYLFP